MSFSQWLLSAHSISPSGNRGFTQRAGWVTDFTSWLARIIDSFWDQCANALTALMEWISDLIQPILSWFQETIESVVDAISGFFGPIVDWFGEKYNAIVDWVSGAIETVVTWTSDVVVGGYEWITTTVVSFGTWVGTSINGGIDWITAFGYAALQALWNALSDLMITGIDNVFKLGVMIVNSIEMPDFIQDYSIGTLLGGAGPSIGWLVNSLHIPEGMMILAAGFAFRFLRKLLTLGQW